MIPLGVLASSVRAGGFTPADLNPAGWGEASELTGLADADPVESWTDLSGNARHLAQGTAGNRPTFRTNVINGHPVVRFDGVDDRLFYGTNFQHTAEYTVATVVRQPVASTAIMNFGPDSDWNTGRQFQYRYNGSNLEHIVFTSTTTPVYTDTAPVTRTNWNIVFGVSRTADVEVYVGNVSDGATARTGTPAAHNTKLALGASIAGSSGDWSQHFAGDIGSWLLVPRALDATERSNLHTYWKNKYNL